MAINIQKEFAPISIQLEYKYDLELLQYLAKIAVSSNPHNHYLFKTNTSNPAWMCLARRILEL